MSVTHICIHTSPALTFRNFIILTTGPSNTLASQFLEFFSSAPVLHPTLAIDSFTHCSLSHHQELQPLHELECTHPTLQSFYFPGHSL